MTNTAVVRIHRSYSSWGATSKEDNMVFVREGKNYCSNCDFYFFQTKGKMALKNKCPEHDTFVDNSKNDNDGHSNRKFSRAMSVEVVKNSKNKKVVRTLSIGKGRLSLLTRTVSVQTDKSVVESSTMTDLVPAQEEILRCHEGSRCHCEEPTDEAQESEMNAQRNTAIKIAGLLLRSMADDLNASVDLDCEDHPIVVFKVR